MSWWDKVGDAFGWLKDTGVPAVGGAIATAGEAAGQGAWHAVEPGVDNTVAPVANAVGWLANEAGRGVATGAIMTDRAASRPDHDGGAGLRFLADSDAWHNAWNDSASITPMQAIQTGLGAVPSDISPQLGMSQDQKDKRSEFFQNTWAGKLSSGAGDLAIDIFADPTAIAAKAVKGAELARTAIAPGEAGQALSVAAGTATTATKSAARAGNLINDTIAWTAGKTPVEIYQHPVFNKNPEGGVLASLFHEADNRALENARNTAAEAGKELDHEAAQTEAEKAKRTLLGAAMGDKPSVDELKSNYEDLANRLYTLSTPPEQSKFVHDFSWNDHGQGALFSVNVRAEPVEVAQQKTEVLQELARMKRVIEGQATVTRAGATPGEMMRADWRVGRLQSTVLHTGVGARPIAIITGQLSNRLDGHVSLRDPVAGYQQLDSYLKATPHITGEMRGDLLNKFVTAASDGDRRSAVQRAESVVFRATAAHYDVAPEDADAFLRAARGRQGAALSLLKKKLYSAAEDDPIASYIDPESGMAVVRDKPILRSQIEDFHPLVDPRTMDSVIRAGSRQRLFENLASHFGNDSLKDAATLGYGLAKPISDGLSSALMIGTRAWKDLTILPRTLAYVARTQADSQARIIAHIGVLNWLGGLPDVTKSLATAYGRKNLLGAPKMSEALAPFAKDVGMEPDELHRILNGVTSGNQVDLASELANGVYQRAVSRGGYTRIHGDNEQWMPAYQRTLLQIQHSPTAMKAVSGLTGEDLRKFVLRSADGQEEWLNVRHSFDDDVDAWLHTLEAHVNHYLPMPEQRIALMSAPEGEKLDQGVIHDWFDNTGLDRMPVHGESTSPLAVNPLAEWYHRGRERLYSLISDVPETAAAKAPLYRAVFQRHLADITSRLEEGGAGKIGLNSPEMMAARKQADRIARREVGQVMFNASHTSNLAHTFRFVAPFWAAWEDMIKKWGKLFYDNPAMLERLRQGWQAPANMGILSDEYGNRIDGDGNHYLKVKDPATGLMVDKKLDPVKDAALIGQRSGLRIPVGWIPKSMRNAVGAGDDVFADRQSLNLLFQGDPWYLPGLGPLAQIPANEIVKRAFSDSVNNPIINYLLPLGTTNDNVAKQYLPAWAKKIVDSGATPFGTDDEWRKQASIMLREDYIKWEQGGRQGPAPSMDSVANRTKNWFLMRSLVNLTSPVSVTPSNEMQFYLDQAHVYQQKFGQVQDSPEYRTALAQYQQKYGKDGKDRLLNDHPEYQSWMEHYRADFPQYFDLSVSVSANESGLVATAKAEALRKKYAKEIRASDGKYGDVIAGPDNSYGLTPDTQYSDIAHDAQLSTETSPGSGRTLRSYEAPMDSMARAEAQKGWMEYQRSHTRLNIWLDDNGYTSLRQAPDDMRAAWQQYVDQLGTHNPYWRADYQTRDESKAVDMLSAMKHAMNGNKGLASQQHMKALQGYMQARDWARQQLAARGGGSLTSKTNADVARVFDGYVQELRQWSVGFEQIYNKYLDSDNLQFDVS